MTAYVEKQSLRKCVFSVIEVSDILLLTSLTTEAMPWQSSFVILSTRVDKSES